MSVSTHNNSNIEPNNLEPSFIWNTDNLQTSTLGQWHHLNEQHNSLSSNCICTDTRKLKKGDVFLAIKGDTFDGHEYLTKAKELGAVASIVSQVQDIDTPQLLVADTKLALGHLGQHVRQQHNSLKVVALTGSMGKTTTKEMLGSILNQQSPTLITRGNLNNDLGVPMMLLELTEQHKFAVFELGANHVGEIAYTTQLVNPDVACVLNIGTAHLGEFGGRDNICKTKAEIFEGLTDNNTAVIPTVDDYAKTLKEISNLHTPNCISFGENDSATVYAIDVKVGALSSHFRICVKKQLENQIIEEVSEPIHLNFAGKHNITNALASVACALSLDISLDTITRGLNNAKAPKGRLGPIKWHHHLFIDDTYNANPDAVLAAADVLIAAKLEEKAVTSILVLGDIGELGADAEAEHSILGNKLSQKQIDYVFTIGDLMTHCNSALNHANSKVRAHHFSSKKQLTDALIPLLNKDKTVVLFKGSRFMKMESIINDVISNEQSNK